MESIIIPLPTLVALVGSGILRGGGFFSLCVCIFPLIFLFISLFPV
jgi:hypothetical protein